MQQIATKISLSAHSSMRKLAMINGDGRLGSYLTFVIDEHIKAHQHLIKEFDELVKKDDDPAPANTGMEDFLK